MLVAEIDPAYEVSMGNPTSGTLMISNGLRLERCNPSFTWSDDSRYLAVPQYFTSFGFFRRQHLAIIDVGARCVYLSKETSWFFQPEQFVGGVLVATKEPANSAVRVTWRIPEQLTAFTSKSLAGEGPVG